MSDLVEQNIIALIWDFDKTLIPGYMQAPLFEHYAVDGADFWQEVGVREERSRHLCEQVSGTLMYLNHVIDYVRDGRFAGLNNARLEEFGARLDFYPGIPTFFADLKSLVRENSVYAQHDLRVEHYIASTGFSSTIRGSAIAAHVDGIWGCEFLEKTIDGAVVIDHIAYALDDTSKTRVAFEINKGVNRHPEKISVNARMAAEDRRVPFHNMIYVADGPSDVPVFSVVKRNGGKTFGVYNPDSEDEFRQVKQLQRDGRIDGMGEADYRSSSQTARWLRDEVLAIADSIVEQRGRLLGQKIGASPKHLNE